MKYRKFGRLGWDVSEIGFGAWALGGGAWGHQDDSDSLAALHRALDLGVNLIDTAAGYGGGRSERIIADALKGRPGQREKTYIVTKTPPAPGHWPPLPHDDVSLRYPEDYLRANLEERLRNLNTDCLDVLLLHTWTRAWNRDPKPLETLRRLKQEGKIRAFGISTAEHDQDQLNALMARGELDVIQIIYNIFDQQPAAEALPVALESGTGVMGRVVFDEGSLTGKFTAETVFPEGDFRHRYFGGDRLARTVARVEKIREDIAGSSFTLPQAAIKFALANPAVSTVIPGMRNVAQTDANVSVSDLPPMTEALESSLRKHIWMRGNWHTGK
ncbi:MAG TPA: aldo/keto reductase [Candidatus Methylacidiphilales bacterium]|nr:aldo/keto reductase [Candidatus Methylacidiphilales bacterium]